MKKALCQVIAIVCILTMGYLTVTPFLQESDANPHKYHYENHYIADVCDQGHVHGVWFVGRYVVEIESHYDGHDNHYEGEGPSWTQDHFVVDINNVSHTDDYYAEILMKVIQGLT